MASVDCRTSWKGASGARARISLLRKTDWTVLMIPIPRAAALLSVKYKTAVDRTRTHHR